MFEEQETTGRQEEARTNPGLEILYAQREAEGSAMGRRGEGHPSRTERTVLDTQSGRRRYRIGDLDLRNQYAVLHRAP